MGTGEEERASLREEEEEEEGLFKANAVNEGDGAAATFDSLCYGSPPNNMYSTLSKKYYLKHLIFIASYHTSPPPTPTPTPPSPHHSSSTLLPTPSPFPNPPPLPPQTPRVISRRSYAVVKGVRASQRVFITRVHNTCS